MTDVRTARPVLLLALACCWLAAWSAAAQAASRSGHDLAVFARFCLELAQVRQVLTDDIIDDLDALDAVSEGLRAKHIRRGYARKAAKRDEGRAHKKLERVLGALARTAVPQFANDTFASSATEVLTETRKLADHLEKHVGARRAHFERALRRKRVNALKDAMSNIANLRYILHINSAIAYSTAQTLEVGSWRHAIYGSVIRTNEAALHVIDAMLFWMNGGRGSKSFSGYMDDARAKLLEAEARLAAAQPQIDPGDSTGSTALQVEQAFVTELRTSGLDFIRSLKKKPDFDLAERFFEDLDDLMRSRDQLERAHLRAASILTP